MTTVPGRGDHPRVPSGQSAVGADDPPSSRRPPRTQGLRRIPDCPTCGQIRWEIVLCECGHPWMSHRHDLKRVVCAFGAGVPPLACDCREFVEAGAA